jgi:hypothetical protein
MLSPRITTATLVALLVGLISLVLGRSDMALDSGVPTRLEG